MHRHIFGYAGEEDGQAARPGPDTNSIVLSGKLDPQRRSLRLMTLVRLRWLAVAGQSAAVLGVYFGLGFELPLAPCLVLIALSAALNLYLRIGYTGSVRLASRHAALLLGYDICQLACLLYLTGGLENPFTFLLLVPVTVSATSLPLRLTLVLAVLVVGAASLLTFFHAPLPWFAAAPVRLPDLYVTGVYFSLLCCLAFLGIYARRIAEEARQMADALAATELVLAREQQLTALDGLAAAAAHELGTPLGTVTIIAKELLSVCKDNEPVIEDLVLLKGEVDRCRTILAKLTSLGETPDAHFARLALGSLIEEVIEPHRGGSIRIKTVLAPQEGSTRPEEPVGRRNPAVLYGLGNLVENASEFASREVVVEGSWNDQTVQIQIRDDGPGFAPDVLDKLGEPYVTTRGTARKPGKEAEFGLGLGFFIAKTLLERSGARIAFANRKSPPGGAVVTIIWPRKMMDSG